MQNLAVTLIQCELAWEQPADNSDQIGEVIEELEGSTDLIVLPEMFTTGFSMNALANAEEPGGATEQWLQDVARRKDCAVTGSIAVLTTAVFTTACCLPHRRACSITTSGTCFAWRESTNATCRERIA